MDLFPEEKITNWIVKYIFNSDTPRILFKATSIFVVAKICNKLK